MKYEKQKIKGERWSTEMFEAKIIASGFESDPDKEFISIEVKYPCDDAMGGDIVFDSIEQFRAFAQIIARAAASDISVLNDICANEPQQNYLSD